MFNKIRKYLIVQLAIIRFKWTEKRRRFHIPRTWFGFWVWFCKTFGTLYEEIDCDGTFWHGKALGGCLYLHASKYSRGVSFSLGKIYLKLLED